MHIFLLGYKNYPSVLNRQLWESFKIAEGENEVLMLDNRKIRLMTQLALYEKKVGKEDIKLSKFYRTDYVRLQVLKTGVMVTIGYLLLLALLVIYQSEYLIANAVDLDYKSIGLKVLGVYLVILTAFVISTLLGFSIKYRYSRKKLSKYFRMLKKLRHIYRVEDGEITEGNETDSGYEEDTIL